MKKKPQKCLVNEARAKCKCDFCKQMRAIEQINLKALYKFEAYKIWKEGIEKGSKNG